jgi:hypothetical protein
MKEVDLRNLLEVRGDYELLQREMNHKAKALLQMPDSLVSDGESVQPLTEEKTLPLLDLFSTLKELVHVCQKIAEIYSHECTRLTRDNAELKYLLHKNKIEMEKDES